MEIQTKKGNNNEKVCRIIDKNIVYDYFRDTNRTDLRISWLYDDGQIEKYLCFHKSSDYSFWGGQVDNYEKQQIEFTLGPDNLICAPLKNFLNGKKQINIDDDDTCEYNKRFMEIKDESKQLVVNILDNREETDKLDIYKLNVFIKNVLYDGRSKIDRYGLDTKDRLAQLFYEINKEFSKQIKYNSNNYEYSLMKYLEYGER